MTKARDSFVALAMGFLLLAPAIYIGSYLVLLNPSDNRMLDGSSTVEWRHPRFEIRHQWIDAAYWPLVEVDRKLRPGYWRPLHGADSRP